MGCSRGLMTTDEPQNDDMRQEHTIHTPNAFSTVKCNHEICFWKLEMGRLDEDAIWNVLIQPVTVLKGGIRDQIRVRARPDGSCSDYTGIVTCCSQGVHVLESGKDWTLIEAYSSADETSDVRIFGSRFEGYVPTSLLKKEEVDRTYSLVVDKLLQKMYVFREGKLFSALSVSTGLAAEDASSLETPAGEFLIVSRVDHFWADDYLVGYGMCINKSIWIHKVPAIRRTEESTGETYMDYDTCESRLGTKGSCGCIRVQRRLTPENVNAKWLYDNLHRKPYTKVIIWDDSGR